MFAEGGKGGMAGCTEAREANYVRVTSEFGIASSSSFLINNQ